ncbi:MAG: hypothetical protein AAF250_11145 [Pseudomonadota bacterium]
MESALRPIFMWGATPGILWFSGFDLLGEHAWRLTAEQDFASKNVGIWGNPCRFGLFLSGFPQNPGQIRLRSLVSRRGSP